MRVLQAAICRAWELLFWVFCFGALYNLRLTSDCNVTVCGLQGGCLWYCWLSLQSVECKCLTGCFWVFAFINVDAVSTGKPSPQGSVACCTV
jgi:hypothetical protein